MADQEKPRRSESRAAGDGLAGGADLILGLGANLGDPRAQLRGAVARIEAAFGPARVSPLYRSRAIGYREQPDFYNVVCVTATTKPPEETLDALLRIERELGRERSFRNAPRTIDIDLLAYGDEQIDRPGLTVPHPRLHERGFVLYPLADVAPAWRHPRLGLTAGEMIAAAPALEPLTHLGPL